MLSLPTALRRRCLGWLGAAALLAALAPAQATQPLPQNLTALIGKADVVVSGTVVSVTDGLQDNVPYTEVTIKVKGSARRQLESGSDFSFRQWGLLAPRRMPNGRYLLPMTIEGMPSWRAGEQVVVFLNAPASATGLRSPVGLNQGKFSALEGRTVNGAGNVGLFDGVSVSASLPPEEARMLTHTLGPVDEDALMNLVQKAVDGRWVETGVMR